MLKLSFFRRRSLRPGTWKRRLGIGVLLVLVVLWFLPAIIAHTPLLHRVIGQAASRFDGTITVGSASLGWFSPIVLSDVLVRDAAGEPLMAIPKTESERTLMAILLNPSQPGRFRCAKPSIEVVFTKDATNLETALARYLAREAEKRPTSKTNRKEAQLQFALDLEAAKITVHDPEKDKKWVLDPVSLHLALNSESGPPLQMQMQAAVAGRASATLEAQIIMDGSADEQTQVKGRMENFPLALIAPILQRFGTQDQVEGQVRGKWDLTWNKIKGRFEGELVAQDCSVSGPSFAGDILRLAEVKMPWSLAYEGSRIRIDKAELTCDLGRASFQGNLDTKGTMPGASKDSDINVSLDIDLARTGERIPRALRLQKDIKLLAGRVLMEGKGTSGPAGVIWQGNVTTTELRGIRGGRNLEWPKPLAIAFRVRQPAAGMPAIEHLRCESDFLKMDAAASADQFTVTAHADLAKLAEPLGRFCDLSDMRLEGSAGLEITVLHKQAQQFQLAGAGFLKSFHWEIAKGHPWHEDSCTITLHAEGKELAGGGRRVDTGYVRMQSGSDLFDAQLTKPITDLGASPWGDFQVKWQGDLSRWQRRLHPSADGLAWAGTVTGAATVQASSQSISLNGSLTATDVILGETVKPKWRDGLVKLTGEASVDWNRNDCRLSARLESQQFTCAARGSIADLSGTKNVDLTGTLAYDLERLEPTLRSYLGSTVKATGKEVRPITLKGPLTPGVGDARNRSSSKQFAVSLIGIKGETGLGWKSIRALGCDVGPADVRATFSGGRLQIPKFATTLNAGQLHLGAEVRLEPEPVELLLPSGPIVERAQVTPAMCAGALAYLAPELAGVTEAQGLISVELQGGRINLNDPRKSEAKGTFSLHAAKIGMSPLIREVSGLYATTSPVSIIKETQVPFEIARGRVYHQNFELAFNNFTIRTSGSVGMDGTLDLVAEMPIPTRWLGNRLAGTALAKQTIRLPVGGTAESPRIDPRALQAASAQFLRSTAADALGQGIDTNLKKLLGGR